MVMAALTTPGDYNTYARRVQESPMQSYLGDMQQIQEKQNIATKKREKEIRGILDEIIAMYAPGGGFGKGTEAMIEREKEKSIAQGTQALVTSGLYGTTMAAGLGKKFEEEVGMPTRLKLEDVRYGQYAGAMGQKAGMVERIEQEPIDYAMLAQLIQTTESAPPATKSNVAPGKRPW